MTTINRKVSSRELRRQLAKTHDVTWEGLVPSVNALLANEQQLIAKVAALEARPNPQTFMERAKWLLGW